MIEFRNTLVNMRMLVSSGPLAAASSRARLDKNNPPLQHMTRMMLTLRTGPLDRAQTIVNHQRSRATEQQGRI